LQIDNAELRSRIIQREARVMDSVQGMLQRVRCAGSTENCTR
jgi:hypothetical protein